MHRNKRKREIVIISLIITLICMTVGYATYSSNVILEGTSTITSSWDIRITDVKEGNKIGTAESAKTPEFNELSASLEANLYKQGDAMEYDITIENKGTLDAKLNDVLTNIENQNSEAVNITFKGYTKGEILKAGNIKTVNVKIEYNPNYEGEETSSETEITFDYVQNNNETSPVENTHLVKYDCIANGGKDCSNNNEYLLKGEDVDLTKTGEKDGYDFIGWNTNKDAKEALTSLKVEDNDITLYAIFKAKDTTPPIIDSINTTSTTNSITAIVSAHDNESEIIKYEYSINNGSYIDNGNNNTYTFTNLKSDTSYKVKVRVTNEANLQAEKEIEGEGINLTDDVVTSGDGLYKDEYEDRYFYRGANPNNYITFNDEEAGWRIISIEPDKTIKIMRIDKISNQLWNSAGVNNWNNASLNTNLNGEYYNSLTSTAQNQIVNHTFYTGAIVSDNNDLIKQISDEKSSTWEGKIGLITVSEYIRINYNLRQCGSFSLYTQNSDICNNSNWTFNNSPWWTISPRFGTSNVAFYVGSYGYVYGTQDYGPVNEGSYGIRPTVYLSSSLKLQGEGTKESPFEIIEGISLPALQSPTFQESGTNSKTVAITYPEGCGSTLTCTYQKDNGEVVNVTSSAVNVEFTKSGSLVATASDGTNTVSSSYTVIIIDSGGDAILNNVEIVTSGDGLYVADEEGRYFYKGKNANNYVTFNNETWRIISIEPDKTIKIMSEESIGNRTWDSSNSNNWTRPASLNTYLNGTYLSGMTSTAQSQIVAKDWSIGAINYAETNMSTQISKEKGTTWNGKVALITTSEYIRSNSNQSSCGTFELNEDNYSGCKNTTWMHNNASWWTLAPRAGGSSRVFYVNSNGLFYNGANATYGVRPAVHLSSDVQITGGTGILNDPYILG